MINKLKDVLDRAKDWPEEDKAELLEIAEAIETRHSRTYDASEEELRAIEDAERSGIANPKDIEKAFRLFRRA
ncbi:hypothetical protein GJW-30_1_01815 [Variibacter gotjawalensis]|uniref:Addiction module component n=1 Tax=Variibacter gotjawalensis TaxID=1333996 RepID=A0A0S3PTS8_9BRAD|nr:hypothetical protein [Variibacter gotjawalensis]NIK49600.1 hypothetical protein [Variibacter gotjawalensis]RZS45611.1 hypothetical protein EV661_3930 [Variibacter gotjawalensis]BAT59284.1 hypothetical protein GJW-30_1_01815 [Variibacter gotjawalensis]